MEMDAKQVEISLGYGRSAGYGSVCVAVDGALTCSQLVSQVKDCTQPGLNIERKEAWHLVERWRGCERRLPKNEPFILAVDHWGGRGCDERQYCVLNQGNLTNRRRRMSVKGKKLYLASRRRVSLLRRRLRRSVISLAALTSSLKLHQLAERRSLPQSIAASLLQPLRKTLSDLKRENLKLSTELSDLNISASQLDPQVQPMRSRSDFLSSELQKVKKEMVVHQMKLEREARNGLAALHTEVIRLRRELETRNRLNANQSTKILSQKEVLTKKRQLLSQKQQELARTKFEIAREEHAIKKVEEVEEEHLVGAVEAGNEQTGQYPISGGRMVVKEERESLDQTMVGINREREHGVRKEKDRITQQKCAQSEVEQSFLKPASCILNSLSVTGSVCSTPVTSKTGHTPSSTRKRMFEARTKQLLESEAEVFRRQLEIERHKGKKGNTTENQDNAKNKKICQHEGRAVRKLTFSKDEMSPEAQQNTEYLLPSELLQEGKKLLEVPQPDSQWYKGTSSPDMSYRDKLEQVFGGEMKAKEEEDVIEATKRKRVRRKERKEENASGTSNDFFIDVMATIEQQHSLQLPTSPFPEVEQRRVHFSPEAILLPAALEGELDTVRECVQKLGGCDLVSHKGASCLHNAVCSGHLQTMEFLVEMGCSVNAQDEDGWTPLHCAVAYSNQEAIGYLLSKGASLFLETQEGDSPLSLGHQELQAQQAMGEEEFVEHAQQTVQVLMEAQAQLGQAEGGLVYALFDRRAKSSAELGLQEGERLVVRRRGREGEEEGGWWIAENNRGEFGAVPYNFLGQSPQHRIML